MSDVAYGARALGPLRNALRVVACRARDRSRLLSSALRRASQFGGRNGIDVAMGDACLRLYPDENVTDKRAYLRQPLLGAGVRSVVERLAASSEGHFRFVDIGGNSGLYSIRFAQIARQASVAFEGVAIEAFPPTFDRMRFNLEASGLLGEGVGKVHAVQAAVSGEDGSVRLATGFRDLGRVRVASDGGVEVRSRPLVAIIAEAGIAGLDLMKIDIEGHELVALAPFFAKAPRDLWPKAVLAEILDEADPLEPLLRNYGYEIIHRSKANAIFERSRA